MIALTVITVNYNQPEVTVQLLLSLKKYASPLSVEVILVDNAPKKDFREEFREHYPALIYIKSDENIGFAGGNNLGIKAAKGKYILLLNNDTEITQGSIETMVQEMETQDNIGLLSPQINYFEDKTVIQYAGFTPMNYITARNKAIGYLEKDENQYGNVSRETGFCHGAAVMCRYSDLLNAGMMDESYFLYYEELDWCEKFKRIGKKIWFTGKAKIYHKESMSVGKESSIKTYFMTRNRMLYIRRNTGLFNRFVFGLYYAFIAVPKQTLSYFLKKRFDLAKYTLSGFWWNVVHSKKSENLGFKIK